MEELTPEERKSIFIKITVSILILIAVIIIALIIKSS